MDREIYPRPTMARLASKKSKPKGKAVDVVDNYVVYSVLPLQRTLSVNPSGEFVLDSPPQVTQRGAQAVKKYFTPKWKEFASHGDLEDVLEAGLAAVIRASAMQLKVLGEFRTRMQEHKKPVAEASKSDKEHKQALEGLQATKVAVEALEVANKEKRRLLDEAESHKQETQSLRENFEVAEKERKEAEAEVARLLGKKNEMEAKLGSVEAEFVANFYNTEAYTNFSD
ncbi:hypothetical protein Adt_33644 [Abeliophyllum distichum]|uniref:Uncharacterized protein n=1 Tax=Abeliophyllum distichum TaxID=126358 RepID=A0ABD1QWT3_9LAMI